MQTSLDDPCEADLRACDSDTAWGRCSPVLDDEGAQYRTTARCHASDGTDNNGNGDGSDDDCIASKCQKNTFALSPVDVGSYYPVTSDPCRIFSPDGRAHDYPALPSFTKMFPASPPPRSPSPSVLAEPRQRAKASAVAPGSQNRIIRFDVRGTRFETTLHTLYSDGPNYLTALTGDNGFSRCTVVGDDGITEWLYVDRDPGLFARVLAYLGGREEECIPEDVGAMRALRREADYYSCDGLVALLDESMLPVNRDPEYADKSLEYIRAKLKRCERKIREEPLLYTRSVAAHSLYRYPIFPPPPRSVADAGICADPVAPHGTVTATTPSLAPSSSLAELRQSAYERLMTAKKTKQKIAVRKEAHEIANVMRKTSVILMDLLRFSVGRPYDPIPPTCTLRFDEPCERFVKSRSSEKRKGTGTGPLVGMLVAFLMPLIEFCRPKTDLGFLCRNYGDEQATCRFDHAPGAAVTNPFTWSIGTPPPGMMRRALSFISATVAGREWMFWIVFVIYLSFLVGILLPFMLKV